MSRGFYKAGLDKAGLDKAGLDPAARAADDAFLAIEREIDWLAALSPRGNHSRWSAFVASGYRRAPPLTYAPLTQDFERLRARLAAQPLEDVEHTLIQLLLREKRSELQRQIDLVALRGRDGFVQASIALFGAPDPVLLQQAHKILDTVLDPILDTVAENSADRSDLPPDPVGHAPDPVGQPPDLVGSDGILAAAQASRAAYRKADPTFDFAIHVEADINSALMVNHGDLWIDADTVVPRARVPALIAHEVGTHVVTRHNGRRQPLRQLEAGLADYDRLQEGLAALAEWLAGCLPPGRLRILAARVVAADLAVAETPLEEIFATLHENHRIPRHAAFDTAVRALRGGGLTKDAVYLAGLADLLAWLAEGHDIAPLFAGKFALSQVPTLTRLAADGLLHPPALLPHHLTGEGCAARLQIARTTPLTAFYTKEST